MSGKIESKAGFGSLLLAIFLDILGFGLIIPILPFIPGLMDVSMFSSETVALGWITAIYSIVQFFTAPFWGKISDKVGRRPIILIGVLGSSLSFFSLAISKTIFWVMFARGLQGFFTGASLPTARAFIADTTPVDERAKKFGLLGAAFGFGFSFGPVLGGFLSKIVIGDLFYYAAPALFASGLSIINFIIAYMRLDESLPLKFRGIDEFRSKNVMDAFRKIADFFNYPGAGPLLIIFGLFNLAFSGFETIFSPYAIHVDPTIQADNIGIIFGIIGGVSIIVQVRLVGPVTKKLGDDRTLLMSLIFLSIGFFSYVFVTDLISLMILTIPIAFGAAFFSPSINSSLSRRIPQEKQGGGLGLNASLGSLGRILGPLISTGIYRFPKDVLPFTSSAVMMLVLALLMIYIVFNKSKKL